MLASLGIDLPSAILLGLALALALSFEFVNGFHDTANAVATVIYTRALKPNYAVVWSGTWNLIGVLTSTGAVAFSIVSLLPVELVINVGSGAGFAMVFALLLSAIIWNVGTWYLGLPASSSHTLIGSIVGVGLMNSLLSPNEAFGEGVNWAQGAGHPQGAGGVAHHGLRARRSAAAAHAGGAGQARRNCSSRPSRARRRRCGCADC